MGQARQPNANVLAWRPGAAFTGAAVALATASLIGATPAAAQTPAATPCTTAACTAAQQGQLSSLLSPFTTLVGTPQLVATFQAETGIYQNATYTQRVQAAQNADLAAVLTLIWQPNNNPSPIAANVQAALANPTVMTQVNNAFAVPNVSSQATFLKANPGFTTYQSFGQSGPYNLVNIDPHPFQTNPAIWSNQWTTATVPCPPGTAASACPVAVQAANWASDNTNNTAGSFPSHHSIGSSIAALTYAVMMPEAYQDLMLSAQTFGLSRNIIGVHYPTDIIGGRIAAYYTMAQLLANNPSFVSGNYGALLQSTAATLRGQIAGGVPTPYVACATNVAGCIAGGAFPTAAQFTAANQAYAAQTNYGLPATGPTDFAAVVPANAGLLIATRFPYLSPSQWNDVLASTELPSGGLLDNGTGWARLNLFAAAGGYGAFASNVTVNMNAALGGFNAIDVWSNNIAGPGGLTKLGTGTLVLAGNNTYTGGTIVGGGTLALSGTMIGNLAILSGATFVSGGGYAVSATSTLSNAGTFQSVNAPLLNQGTIANSGTILGGIVNLAQITNSDSGIIHQGVTNNAGGTLANIGTIHGGVTNNAGGTVTNSGAIHDGVTNNAGGTLSNSGTIHDGLINNPGGTVTNSGLILLGAINASQLTNTGSGAIHEGGINTSVGSLTNSGTVNGGVFNAGVFTNNGVANGPFINTGLLSGNGTIVGNVANAGVISPGNSPANAIGTLSIAGNYVQLAGSTYQVEVNASGQGDLINVVGGAAALQGGAVGVSVQPGTSQAWRTTYRILSASGGVAGAFTATVDPYPFLLPQLSYDANNAYLTLQIGGFAAAAQTRTQAAVGRVLDANVSTASGDFAQVLSAMATNTLSSSQAQATLTALSGQNYSTFSSTMVQGAQLFMNNFSNQTGGGGSPVSNRVALAEACDIACGGTSPPLWGAWGGALGGLGTIGANAGTGAVTYNVGGFAAGLDRLVASGVRVGVTTGYTTGTQWTGGFSGNGMTDSFLAGLYGNAREGRVYADAVAGYAYSYNQMWRQIFIPGLQQRTAQGRTGSNQFYGQIESGYRFDLGTAGTAVADTFVTPFARLQGYTGNQNAFTETGAQSLNLTVAQQTTNSLRSVLGAQLGGAIDLGWREKLALQFRLGWSHEYASRARPVTATLGGAPLMPFTTYGIAPTRDGAVVGFSANTAIAEPTSAYIRYEGNISGQDSAHALTAGVRMAW